MEGLESEGFRALRGLGSPWEQRDTEETRRLLDRAVAASYNGIVITDPTLPDDPIIYANSAFERTTGYAASEVIGRNCRFLQGEDRDQTQIPEIASSVSEGREIRSVLRNYRKSGEMFWNELYISPVFDENDRLTNFIGVQHDITERKLAEDALSAQEAQWRTLVENNPAFVALLDARGNASYYNPGWLEYLGEGEEETTGRRWLDWIHPDDAPQVSRGMAESAESGVPFVAPALRIRRHDGVYGWFTVTISPVFGEGGEVTSWISVSTDIEASRRAEAALRESEERLRMAFRTTLLGSWDYNVLTRELRWDERTKAMFGLSPEAEVSWEGSFVAGLHPDDRERSRRSIERAFDPESGGEYDIEYRTIGLEDGEERWVRSTGRVFFEEMDGEARPFRFIGTVLDITRRKRSEVERDLLLAREQLARSEAVAARRRLDFLVEADAVLLSSVGYFERLRKTAGLIVPDLADWCLVDIIDEDGSIVRAAAAHADPEKQELLEELQRHRSLGPGSSSIAARVLAGGGPELVQRAPEEMIREVSSDAQSERMLQDLGVSSLIGVPLVARGRTLGVITLVSSERRYFEEDLALAESLAYRCALAVDNAHLYRERGRIARTLQRSLLPRLPEVEGLEVGLEYLPVGVETEIGGDFYDLIWSEDGALYAVVGDVCGKGPEAAAVTALARYTIQAVAVREDSPARVLSRLNEAMLRQLEDLKFCTVVCARLCETSDSGGFDLTVSRGGHPAPLVLRADGGIEEASPNGRALGVFEDPNLREGELRLEAGDSVVFYTDGLTEARNPDGELFGEERLISLLGSHPGLGAKEVSTLLKNAALDFGGEAPRDDIAILVIRVPE